MLFVFLAASVCQASTVAALPGLRSPTYVLPTPLGPLQGPIRAPGGPYLYDSSGRVVFLHGVNAVYKRPPYELFPAPGKPWNFGTADASLMARLGFNVVRLGITWRGLEPGTAPANDPAICSRGTPGDPGQYNQAVLDNYLAKVARTVALLGRFHIYTLLDMHQDVYNEMFDGEGAPNWAVCTDGVSNTDPPGRWSRSYGTAAAGIAYRHFWTNDVVGNLQGEYDRVWAAVASYFRGNPWVLGYDPFNEPFSTSLVRFEDEMFDAQLECFYTGQAAAGRPLHGAPAITCPPQDPVRGVIPGILSADPSHLVFYEPDIYSSHGLPNFVGPMDFPNLVFNVHVYCSHRSGKTGNPTDLSACVAQEARSLATRSEDRRDLGTPARPAGPAWFVSEFGRHLELGSSAPADPRDGPHAGGLDLLVVEVLRRPDGQRPRGPGPSRRPLAGHRPRALPHLPRGHRRDSAVDVVRPGQRRLPPRLPAEPLGARPHRHLRADRAALRRRLLRPGDRARIVSGAGSTYLELVNADRGDSVRVTVRRGSC